jgi:hypothetical protein
MDGMRSTHGEDTRGKHFNLKNLKAKHRLEQLGLLWDSNVKTNNHIINKWGSKLWTGFRWLSIGVYTQ